MSDCDQHKTPKPTAPCAPCARTSQAPKTARSSEPFPKHLPSTTYREVQRASPEAPAKHQRPRGPASLSRQRPRGPVKHLPSTSPHHAHIPRLTTPRHTVLLLIGLSSTCFALDRSVVGNSFCELSCHALRRGVGCPASRNSCARASVVERSSELLSSRSLVAGGVPPHNEPHPTRVGVSGLGEAGDWASRLACPLNLTSHGQST